MKNLSNELAKLLSFAIEQGNLALKLREESRLETHYKTMGGVVTKADIDISESALKFLPSIVDLPVLSEEHRLSEDYDDFWIIDPIDGTRTFVSGHYSWAAASIALIINNRPILAVTVVPARDERVRASPLPVENCRLLAPIDDT